VNCRSDAGWEITPTPSWEGFGSGKKVVAGSERLVRSLVTAEKRRKKDEHSGNRQTALWTPSKEIVHCVE